MLPTIHRGLFMIKPDAYLQIGKIVNLIEERGFTLSSLKFVRLEKQDAEKFYLEHRGKPYFNQLIDYITSDIVVAIEVISDNCISKIKDVVNEVRKQFGQDQIKNAIHGSDSSANAAK